MRPRVRRLLWLLLAVLAVVLAGNLSPLLDRMLGTAVDPGEVTLSARDWQDMEATLDLAEESLTLSGRWSGRLPRDQVDPVTFLLDRSLRVTSVTVDGVSCEERPPTAADLIAQPRHLRVHPLPESFEASGEQVQVEILFNGQAMGVAAERGRPGPPVVFSGQRPYLPWVGSATYTTTLLLQTPLGWPVTTAQPITRETSTARRDVWRVTCGDSLPTFALGPLQEQTIRAGERELLVRADALLDAEQGTAALQWMADLLPAGLPQRLRLVLVSGLPQADEGRLGPDLWILAAPRSQAEWVRALGRVVQDRAGRVLAPPLRGLADLLGVLSIPLDRLEEVDRFRSRHFQGRGGSTLEAWLGVRRWHPQISAEAAVQRWFREGTEADDWEDLLGDEAAARTARWVSAGVDIRLRDLDVRVTGNRFELTGRLHVRPPPPPELTPSVEVLLVSRKRSELFLVDCDGEWTRFRESSLPERPTRVELDPRGRHPDLDRHDNAVSLSQRMDPSAFAVTEDSALLAVVPEPNHLTWPYGVYLYDLEAEERQEPRWMEVPGRVVDMHWIEPEQVLLLELESKEEGRFPALLDWEGGRLRRFRAQAEPAPGGSLVLLQEERLPGRFRHAFYDIGTRREVPFLNDHPGRLRWARNDNLLVAEQDDGSGVLFRTDGTVASSLGGPFFGREVRRTLFGVTYVTDGAWASELRVVDRDERMRVLYPAAEGEPAGRILGYFLTPDPLFIFVFLEQPDGTGYRVVRFSQHGTSRILYQGTRRPLADLHSLRGTILVEPSPSMLGAEQGIVRLSFHEYDRDDPLEGPGRILSEDAHLSPAPVLRSDGRYLYYIRSDPTPQTAPARDRPRSLYRHDFLTDQEEPLFIQRG